MDIYLDRLELHGFKSFPEKTVLKFHKGITAVIGPNGCGKSNIVDSILWVMGEQKIKNLRGENSEDLIFNGSASKKPLGMTEVGAYFANHGEETYIARRFFRSGDSKYIMNERYCRNKDIQDLLFKFQLGGTSYFIFEQGSIEKLVSLKPSEKRMLIEEAADISKYLLRKKETANKLIIAEQNLDNISILITDKENRLRELRNQVNYVQRYRTIKSDKTDHLKTFLKRKHDAYQTDFKANQEEIEKLFNHESVAAKDIAALEKTVLHLEEKRWGIDKELKLNQQKVFDFNKKAMAAKSEIDRAKQTRTFKNQRIHEIKNTITANGRDIEDIEKQNQTTTQTLKDLDAQLKKETSGGEDLESKLVDLNDQLELTTNDNAGLKSEIFNVQNELSRINNKIKEIDKRMMRIENEVSTKENFITQLNSQVSTDEITKLEKEITTFDQRHTEKEALYKQAETAYNETKQQVETLAVNARNHKHDIRNLENQKTKYQEVKKKLAGEAGHIPDIPHHGFLQDLVKADKEYHTLLENFYYDEMDALMLANSEDFLGHHLNKALVSHHKVHRLDDTLLGRIRQEPGFIARIKDLYQLETPELKDFFKDGVLVDTLKNAIAAFVKYGVDMVTRDGETISKDGLLVRSREKGILDVIDEIRDIDEKTALLRTEAQKINEALEKERAKQPELAKKVETLRSERRALDKQLMQHKSSLETLKKNRETNLKRVKFTQSEIELLEAEKEKLQDEFEGLDVKNGELEDSFNSLSQRRDQFRKDVQRIKDEINAVEKNYLQKESAINLVKEKINSANADIKRLKANKLKLENTIDTSRLEIKQLETEIEELRGREEQQGKIRIEASQAKEQLETVVARQEKEFNQLNTEIRNNSTVLNQKRKTLEDLKDEKKQVEITFSSIKKDLFQLEDVAFKELNTELKTLEAVPELMEKELSELESLVEAFNERLIKMRDSNRLNFSAESEYELLTTDYNFLLTQKDDVVKSIEDMNEAIRKIDEESKVSFMEAYNSIKGYFEKNFQILFEGGEAELSLMDPENVLEGGLEIKAQPPGKRLLSLKLLSGGEKTLTSLAFLFAMFEYKPSPFCVFDEVDASLDEANIQRFLKFLHKLKEKTQFLIITHNFKTMEEADYLYGISMNEPGISTIYSMKMTGKGKFEKA